MQIDGAIRGGEACNQVRPMTSDAGCNKPGFTVARSAKDLLQREGELPRLSRWPEILTRSING